MRLLTRRASRSPVQLFEGKLVNPGHIYSGSEFHQDAGDPGGLAFGGLLNL
ncbi:MAG TPA: hypothetical protein VNH18_27795 [Bryobacteraceae bacterium]|nr:hypothetical protein [Bryobacteraceae bacterium]